MLDSRTLLDSVAVFGSTGGERRCSYTTAVQEAWPGLVIVYNGYNHYSGTQPARQAGAPRAASGKRPAMGEAPGGGRRYARIEADVDDDEEAELRRLEGRA